MTSKRIVLVAGVSLALVMALGAGMLVGSLTSGSAFAQGPTGTPQAFGPGMMGRGLLNGQQYTGTVPYGGYGMMGGRGMMGGAQGFGYSEVMLPSLAKSLGLTVEQLQAELKAGKTVAELAKAKGISIEKLTADLLAAHKEYLAGLVKAGKITQQNADRMLDRMDDVNSHPCLTGEVTPGQGAAPTQGFTGGPGRGGMMGGRGMMGGWGARGTSN